MKLKQFLNKALKEKNLFIGCDIAVNLQEILDLTNNFEILYGVNIELDFKPIKAIKGRNLKWVKGVADELFNSQIYANKHP